MNPFSEGDQGFQLALAKKCPGCQGSGWTMPYSYSANSGNGYGQGIAPGPVRCDSCLKGFHFQMVKPDEFLTHMFQVLREQGPRGRQLRTVFLELMLQSTEENMVKEPVKHDG